MFHWVAVVAAVAAASATPADAMLCARYYETLFDAFLECSGCIAVHPEHQHFALGILNFLTTIHRTKLSLAQEKRRHNEFIKIAASIVPESEKTFGPMQTALVLYEKGYVLRHEMMSALEDRRATEAVETWKRFLVVDRAMYAKIQIDIERPKKKASSLSELMSNPEDADYIQKRGLQIIENGCGLISYYHNRQRNSLALIEKLALTIEGGKVFNGDFLPALKAMDEGTAEMIGELEK